VGKRERETKRKSERERDRERERQRERKRERKREREIRALFALLLNKIDRVASIPGNAEGVL